MAESKTNRHCLQERICVCHGWFMKGLPVGWKASSPRPLLHKCVEEREKAREFPFMSQPWRMSSAHPAPDYQARLSADYQVAVAQVCPAMPPALPGVLQPACGCRRRLRRRCLPCSPRCLALDSVENVSREDRAFDAGEGGISWRRIDKLLKALFPDFHERLPVVLVSGAQGGKVCFFPGGIGGDKVHGRQFQATQ